MAIAVNKPGRATKGGKKEQQKRPPIEDIYSVGDSDWDLLDIPFADISPNPFNDRDMGDLEELADDIASNGLDTPVTVMHCEPFVDHYSKRFPDKVAGLTTKYVLGPGERRFRAAMIAAERTGAVTVRAYLRDALIPTIRLALIRENYHRKNPTPLERARHIKRLQDEEGMGYTEICAELGIKSRGTITKMLALLDLPEEIQQAVHKGQLPQKTGFKLCELADEDEAVAALALVVEKDMSPGDAVRQVRVSAGGVSQGNTTSDGAPAAEDGDRPVPASVPSYEAESTRPDVGYHGQEEKSPEPTQPTTPPTKPKSDRGATDTTAAERAAAGRARELACIKWLGNDALPPHDQLDSLLQHALLTGGKTDSRARALGWLTQTGKAHFDIKDPDDYFPAVLSSGDQQLIDRATWAAALASQEVRAADRRRPALDHQDAAYLRLLIEATGYEPSTQWERNELKRLGVSLGNSSGDHPVQESA